MGLIKGIHLFFFMFSGETLFDVLGEKESCPAGCSACMDGILECKNFMPFNQTDIEYLDTLPKITQAKLWSNPQVESNYPWSEAVNDVNEHFVSLRESTDCFQSEHTLSWSDAVGNYTKNYIRDIQKGLFFGLEITHVTKEDFDLFDNLSHLGLACNNIQRITDDVFPQSLTVLDLRCNEIRQIDSGSLPSDLEELILDGNDLSSMEKGALPQSLSYVSADKYFVCCFVSKNSKCVTPPPSFATCDGLLQHWGYRATAWILSVVASVTNLIALNRQVVTKSHQPETRSAIDVKTNANVFLASLSLSDFLMGAYLLSISIADAWFGSDYFTVYSKNWQTGPVCGIIGIVGSLSVVASLLNLTVMSIDKLVWTVCPKRKNCFHRIWADTVCAIIWALGTVVAMLPLLLTQKFERFYEHSDVCISLPLAAVPRRAGTGFQVDWQNQLSLFKRFRTLAEGVVWTYSTFIYTCLSTVCILIASLCYTIALISRFQSVEKFQAEEGRNAESRLATKMSLIVGVNVLCWLFVITLTVLSQLSILPPHKSNSWLIIVVLPLKSVLSPLIYSYGSILKFPQTKRDHENKPGANG